MKRLVGMLFMLLAVNLSFGQISFRTGDKDLDAELNVLNTDARKDLATFKENAAKELSLSKEKIQALLDKKLEPAEIILSGRIAKVSGKSVDDVVKSYEKNKDKGWGAVAKEMGIKPGSPEFHALKGKPKKAKGNSGNNGNSGKGKGKGKG